MILRCITIGLLAGLSISGCQERRDVSTTTGSIVVECDEAVVPVMKAIVDDFKRTYAASDVSLVSTSVQSAIVNFINDSTQMIVTARPVNDEETAIIGKAGFEYREYNIAIDAVAVILNKGNPTKELRLTQLDSILTGRIIRWPPWSGTLYPVQPALGTLHSSATQIVTARVLGGKQFSPAAQYFESTPEIIRFVQENEGAIGLVTLSWLQGLEEEVTIAALSDPGNPPEPPEPPGMFYKPFQAHVYRDYYPLSTRVYIYNRERLMTVGLGLISYTNNIQGQRLVQNSGLVPATLPVRLVETTSQQVTEQ